MVDLNTKCETCRFTYGEHSLNDRCPEPNGLGNGHWADTKFIAVSQDLSELQESISLLNKDDRQKLKQYIINLEDV